MRRVSVTTEHHFGTPGSRRTARRRRPRHLMMVPRGVPAIVGAALLAGALVPPTGGANTRSTVAGRADSTGPIVVDSAGNGYVAWASSAHNTNGDPLWFCKIPKGGKCTHSLLLPIPKGTTWDDYEVNQPFPVLGGKAGVVSIVGPSYDLSDVVVWTSHNKGASFGEPQVIGNCMYNGTGTGDVLRSPDADPPYYPDYFSIGSSNPGLFYTFTGIGAIGALDPPVGFPQNTGSVPGAVASVTVGYGKTVNPGDSQTTQTVEAFSTDADKPRLDYFWAPLPGVSGSPDSLEHGPINVGIGINPRLAGGPDGLFLLSEDYVANPDNASKPLHLDVRKWNPKTDTFGTPTLVAKVPNDIDASNVGGFTEDDSNGVLTVAWPTETTGGGYEMDMWTSANNGKTFSRPTSLASISFAYVGPARVASVGGHGFVTWQDSRGLELVDLAHL
ncbi:MAG: hypothetical protein ACLQK4_05985 [Acidimicrobiales bacterium]